MKSWLLVGFSLAIASYSYAQTNLAKPELTVIQKLKAENLQLKSNLNQCRAQLTGVLISREQNLLVDEIRTQLKAGPNDVFDWDKLEFKHEEVPTSGTFSTTPNK